MHSQIEAVREKDADLGASTQDVSKSSCLFSTSFSATVIRQQALERPNVPSPLFA